MELNERLVLIRKKQTPKLTQTDFAASIGMTRAAYKNYESGDATPSDAILKLISVTYNVSETWLRTGEGEMFVETPNDFVNGLIQQYHLGPMERKMLETFLTLPDAYRDGVVQYVEKLVESVLAERSKIVSKPTDSVSPTSAPINDGNDSIRAAVRAADSFYLNEERRTR